jgi:hypothetical protein
MKTEIADFQTVEVRPDGDWVDDWCARAKAAEESEVSNFWESLEWGARRMPVVTLEEMGNAVKLALSGLNLDAEKTQVDDGVHHWKDGRCLFCGLASGSEAVCESDLSDLTERRPL